MRLSFTLFPRLLHGLALTAGLLAALAAGPATAQTIYGLSGTNLVSFAAAAPAAVLSTKAISGVAAGQKIVGLDFRPNTGELFALGYDPSAATANARLYVVNRSTGAATAVGAAPITLALGDASASARVGFDFNPTVDRIRVVGGNRANYRLNPNSGAIAFTDGQLAYGATDANNGQVPSVGAAAYSNSYIGATATFLYDIDEANGLYLLQNPPNDGTLVTLGPLGVATNGAGQATDLDFAFNTTTRTNTGYLVVATGGAAPATTLYTVGLTTGMTTAVGPVGTGLAVTDIAVQIDRPAALPAITGQLVYALAGTNLLTFDSSQPGTIRTSVGLAGVPADQVLVALDVRPANNALYALGYRATDQMAQLYTLNATTGAVTAVGGLNMLALGTGTAVSAIGFDFNPTVDRIRVVGSNGLNLRLNPVDGTVAGTDTNLAYAAGDANVGKAPAVATIAYTNSFAGATAASGTTLFDYDRALNVLATQAPPNDGKLNTVGGSGLTLNPNPTVSLDIYTAAAGATPMAYLAANAATTGNASFYSLSLTTGAATLVGLVGTGSNVRDIAVAAGTGVVTGTRGPELARGLGLYPNPFAGTTEVRFELNRPTRVELRVSDALGRRVATLQPGALGAGVHTLRWDGASQRAGLYFFSLQFDGQPAGTRQGVLVR